MKAGLELTEARAGDLATGNLIGYLALALTCGFLASHFSPKKIITFFMLLTSLSMLLTGMSESFASAFTARVLSGMGGGGTNIPVMGVVVSWFAVNRRGLATGLTVSGSSFGLLITGLAIPPVLTAYGADGWRYAWFFLALLIFVIALLCWLFIYDKPSDKGLAPCGSVSGFIPADNRTYMSLMDSWRMVYKNKTVWHLAGIYSMFGFGYIIYTMFFVRYLTGEGGFSIQSAGRLWSFVGACSIASGLLWGTFSDKFGRKTGLCAVFSIQALSFTVFGISNSDSGFFISAGLFALTAWSIPAIVAAASGDVLGPRLASAALGFITLFFGIGQALGPFAAGRIADQTGSYTIAFIAAGAASAAGALLSLALTIRRE
jgi:sugar phosphate permease